MQTNPDDEGGERLKLLAKLEQEADDEITRH
jgi:hypothetical protein